MITFNIFFPQRDIALQPQKLKQRKKEGKDPFAYDVFFYLLTKKNGKQRFKLKKFNYNINDNFLKYDEVKIKNNLLHQDIPVLKEVKFKELVLDLPDDSDTYDNVVRHCLKPSGIIVELLKGNPFPVETHGGRYAAVRKYKLLIPEKYFIETE